MSHPLLYIDFEGPGVPDGAGIEYVAKQPIFEVAAILLSYDLEHEYGRYESVIRPNWTALEELRSNDFVLNMHTVNGLYAELTASTAESLPTLADAEDAILTLLDTLPPGQKVIVSGSGVARYDRPQIDAQMPRLAARLTYDEQDISSARKRYESIAGAPIVPAKPAKTHRAMADIEDDIRYQRAFDNVYRSTTSENVLDPVGRQLLALALTEQYMAHDSFLNADGAEIATTRPPKMIQSLLEGVPALEVVAGYMSLTEQLLRLLSELAGMHPDTALSGMRATLIDSGASSSKPRA